jgi:hypothetical protein
MGIVRDLEGGAGMLGGTSVWRLRKNIARGASAMLRKLDSEGTCRTQQSRQ